MKKVESRQSAKKLRELELDCMGKVCEGHKTESMCRQESEAKVGRPKMSQREASEYLELELAGETQVNLMDRITLSADEK